jgi:hypothetical protein
MRARKGFSPGIRRSGSPSNNREPPLAIPKSVLSDFNGLRRHFRAILVPEADALVARRPWGKPQPNLSVILKNNTKSQPAWQEIVELF